jgi:26S proteasome regulatory subunit N2
LFLKSQEEKQLQERIEKILSIISGEITIGVNMQFLIKNNHADLLILKQIKVRISMEFILNIFIGGLNRML